MAHGRGRVWTKRLTMGAALVVIVGGGVAAWKWPEFQAMHAGRQFRAATTDDQREHWAAQLIDHGERGQAELVEAFRSDDEPRCVAAANVLRERLSIIDPQSPEYSARCQSLLDGFASFTPIGQTNLIELLPDLRKCPQPEVAARIETIAREALSHSASDVRVRAIRTITRLELPLLASVAPLLRDPDDAVRRAAILAVGPAPKVGEPAVSTEDLFRCLHDPDAKVRDYCETALLTRGLDADHVRLARFLAHPEPSERLKLLAELQAGGSAVKDPGPWLERLSRDDDPAVRLGAARVAFETRLQYAKWLDALADRDTDPTVRRWAGYYRGLSSDVRQTSFEPGRE